MKIGIITFHEAINFGAVLQTYALQKTVQKFNVECDIIDYKNDKFKIDYKAFNKNNIKGVNSFIKELSYLYIKSVKRSKFKKFINNNIQLSKIVDSQNMLSKINNEYHKFITGSDQVWNLGCTNNDVNYFLDFVTCISKKNSYAASFGIAEIPNEQKDKYKKLLKSFNNISVREIQGAKIVKDLVNRDASVNLDPTLLLNKEEWSIVCNNINSIKEDYILVYLMAHSDTIMRFAEDLSKKTACKIIHINSNIIKRASGKYIRTAGPSEFIKLFIEAKYIVTNSFHGTVFSINFNKNFFVELLPPPAKVNSRLENVMDLFDLRDREIINGKNDNILKNIDYREVNYILNNERKKSLEYLKSIIEEKNE